MTGEGDPRARGGKARAEALTPEQRSSIAKKAAESRWALPRAVREGVLEISGFEIPCAVLEGGRRVLTQSGFMVALGRARQAKSRRYYSSDVNMPAFLTASNLKPYIPDDLGVTSIQIEFRPLKGGRAFGYSAELLPRVCSVFLDAEKADVLTAAQKPIGDRARLLLKGFAHVGITALVDEATGYQELRDRKALQAILDAFLRKELAAWAKRFPDEFYEQIFRLRDWKWTGRKKNPPQVVAHYTKDLVYARLAPQILEELERRNPIQGGRRKAKHHQYLTDDVGHPALAQHLYAVLTLMRVSSSWRQFMRMLDLAHPKRGDTLLLPVMAESAPSTELERPSVPPALSLFE
jgi:hypothetical protein